MVMGYQLKCCSVNDRSTVGEVIIDTSQATPTSKQSQRLLRQNVIFHNNLGNQDGKAKGASLEISTTVNCDADR